MPRLPSGESLGQRPVPRGSYSVASADTSAVPRAVAGLGGALGKVAEEYDREQDANAVFAARRALDDWERDAIFGEKGAAKRLGQEAFGVPDELGKSFDEIAGKVSESLTSNRQRKAFEELAASRRAQVMDWGSKHALREKQVFDAGQFEADIKSMTDRAALFPDRAAGELAIARQRIHGFMRDKGRSTEEIEQAVKDTESRVHSNVISAMLNAGNGEKASEYLQANKAGMTADAALRAEAGLKEITARTRAQGFADDAMSRGLKADEALREAREKFSGTDETAAVQEIKSRFAEVETVRAQAQRQASDEAWKVLTNGGSRKSIPPALWNSLGGEEQRQINDYVEAKWRRAKADAKQEPTDMGTYYGLRLMASEQPEVFAKLDLMKSQPFLRDGDLKQLIDLQGSFNKGDLKAMESQRTVKRTLGLVKSEIAAAGIDMTPKEGTKQAKDTAAFMGQITMALDEATAAKGKPLTDDEAKRIGMGMLREGFVQGSGIFFDDKKLGFQATPEERAKFVTTRYTEIPADIRAEIERDLYPNGRRRGETVDRERVERIYMRAQAAGRVN